MIIGISGKIGRGKDEIGSIIQYLTSTGMYSYKRGFSYASWKHSIEANTGEWEIKKFADKVKDMVCLLIGCTREQLEDRDFKEKELGEEWDTFYINNPKLGRLFYPFGTAEEARRFALKEVAPKGTAWEIKRQKTTPRLLMQLLGTECGRDIIHPNIWVNALFADYNRVKTKIEGHMTTGSCGRPQYSSWIITDTRFPNELQAVKDRGGITIRVERSYKHSMSQGKLHDSGKDKSFIPLEHPSETALDSAEFDYVIQNDKDIPHLVEQVKAILITEKLL
jgi:hypothetical protein